MSRRPLVLLTLAMISACAAFAVWIAAFHIGGLRTLDADAMEAFTGVARDPLEPSIRGVAVLADPTWFLAGGALLAAVALLRRRWLMAAVVPVVLLGANATTQLIKPALTDPRAFEMGGEEMLYRSSWPSGHSTAAMSLALCFVLVVGRRSRQASGCCSRARHSRRCWVGPG